MRKGKMVEVSYLERGRSWLWWCSHRYVFWWRKISQGDKFEFLDKWKSAGFAQSTWELPEWFNVFRQFRKSMHLTYLFITWFLGCGVGLVFTFLFWHLQDVGGTPTLFGICSVINHISEVLAYFFSSYFIKRFGHTKVSVSFFRWTTNETGKLST